MNPARLVTERLLASAGSDSHSVARQEVVLLHGWGSSRACWRPLLAHLRPWANVTLVDLPGLGGAGTPRDLDSLLAAVLDAAPARAVYLGWSLGGQLATLLAVAHPERVDALVTVASNPRLTGTASWPGVPRRQLELVSQGYAAAPERTLARFEALQALQLPGASELRQRLCASREAHPASMAWGLDWLARLDLRTEVAALEQPQLHLLGGLDRLVPAAVGPALQDLLGAGARRRVRVLADGSHALPLQAPAWVAGQTREFLEELDLLWPQAVNGRTRLPKSAIAGSFSRAAPNYDRVAGLQRDVGERLLRRLEAVRAEVATVLDLGCGTGHFYGALRQRYPNAHYIGLDLATGMLEYARAARGRVGCWVAGDAEQLPLAADSVDLVFSSLAIQWCQHPEALFSELVRVLRPGGACVFSTLGPATLNELRAAWAAVDNGLHVNEFLPAQALEQAATSAGGAAWRLEQEGICLRYERARDLIDELRTLGAHNVQSGRQTGLGGRQSLKGMLQAYERFREQGELPATYEVYFGRLEKAAQPG